MIIAWFLSFAKQNKRTRQMTQQRESGAEESSGLYPVVVCTIVVPSRLQQRLAASPALL